MVLGLLALLNIIHLTLYPDSLTINWTIFQVHTVSVALSFFGICWSLASFNKNVRSKDIDKLVLTWIGVIFQLLWRLGTVSSRVLALVVYASAWPDWIILVVSCFYKFAIAICSKTPSRILGILEEFLLEFLKSSYQNFRRIHVISAISTKESSWLA